MLTIGCLSRALVFSAGVIILPAYGGALAQPVTPPSTPSQGAAETPAPERDVVVVFGRAEERIGQARSASEGMVGYADLSTRPVSRAAELVEVIPGMIATEHSNGGKANQYFLRGFNLDHGTDFAGFIDGAPLNQRSHPHMSGYLDLNMLIVDLVERVSYLKGIHYAENGDYTSAGSASFMLYDRLPQSYIKLRAEPDAYALSAAGSWTTGETDLLLAATHEGGDGPFDLSADLDKTVVYAKMSQPLKDARLRLSFIGYRNSWTATDQIPLRAVEAGTLSRLGFIDPGNGGDTSRYILSAGLEWNNASLIAYAQTSHLDLFHNFTYFTDPLKGDQTEQTEDRLAAGFRGELRGSFDVLGVRTDARLGADAHVDWIRQSGLYRTTNRIRTSAIASDRIDVMLADVWAEATFHWTERLRATAGLRADYVTGSVTGLNPANEGDASGLKWSPKLSIAYRLSEDLEIYAGGGSGFHTNNIVGVLQTRDPLTGEETDPATLFAESRGGEIGLRWEPAADLNVTASAFTLDFDSELIYRGDSGVSEPSDPTRRRGIELSAFWRPYQALAIDVSYALSHTRFRNAVPGFDRVPNTIEGVAAAGLTWLPGDGWEAAIRVRYLGPGPLVEDDSVRSPSTTLVNAGVSKQMGTVKVGFEILNLFDVDAYDMVYFYESRLRSESVAVADIHFHPVRPLTAALSLTTSF
jgi:hypothetical protein